MLTPSLVKLFPAIAPDSAIIKLTPSGNYVAGGDVFSINPAAWSDPGLKGGIGYPESGVIPGANPSVLGQVGFTATALNAAASVIPGATQATYKLQQFVAGSATEIAASAYAAGFLTGYWLLQVFF